MTILVTGGAGYIGSHFIYRLLNKSDMKIVVVDNFSQGKKNVIKNDRVLYYEVDLCEREALERIFTEHKIDIVAHFAARASVPDSMVHPFEYYKNNVIGGLHLLEVMRKNNIFILINSSSASVFGEPITEEIKEDHPKVPTNPYGYTKLVFENILKDYHDAYGLKSISFRYLCASGCDESGIIGEHHQPETHIIPSLIKTLSGEREEFCVYGDDFPTKDGSGIRDFVHVNDIADAHLLAMEKLLAGTDLFEFYNLGISKGFSVLELIKVAEKVSGKKLNYKIKGRRPGDPSKLVADSTKAKKELGWEPKYLSIEEIFKTAYDYFNKQK